MGDLRPPYRPPEAAALPFTARALAQRWGCPPGHVYKLIGEGALPRSKGKTGVLHIPVDVVHAVDETWKARRPVGRLARRIMGAINKPTRDGGYVYFLQCRELVKIGYSLNPSARCAQIQDGIPFEVTPLGHLPASRKAERNLHWRFMTRRECGEWFRISDDLKEAILLVAKHAPTPATLRETTDA